MLDAIDIRESFVNALIENARNLWNERKYVEALCFIREFVEDEHQTGEYEALPIREKVELKLALGELYIGHRHRSCFARTVTELRRLIKELPDEMQQFAAIHLDNLIRKAGPLSNMIPRDGTFWIRGECGDLIGLPNDSE